MTRILYSDRKNTSLKTGFKEEEEGHRDMKRHEPGGLFSVTVIEIREQETQHDKLDSKKVFSAKKDSLEDVFTPFLPERRLSTTTRKNTHNLSGGGCSRRLIWKHFLY